MPLPGFHQAARRQHCSTFQSEGALGLRLRHALDIGHPMRNEPHFLSSDAVIAQKDLHGAASQHDSHGRMVDERLGDGTQRGVWVREHGVQRDHSRLTNPSHEAEQE